MKVRHTTVVSTILFFFCYLCTAQSANENDSKKVKSFEETILILKERGLVENGENPEKPKSMPKYSDESPLGLGFYDFILENENLSLLDLERTFFNKSEINTCSFKRSKLKESNFCWNDFYHTDFSNADLSGSDLRASIFENVYFIETDLTYSDLRQSSFDNCDFTSAKLKGAKLTREQKKDLKLSEKQINEINWMDSEGEEPEGG